MRNITLIFFMVIALSCSRQDRESWIRAIRFDQLPWISVSDLSYPESRAAAVYNVTELPVTFLVDQDRQIVGKNLTKTELERKLSAKLSN